MPNLGDAQRAELAAAVGGAVWAAMLWWLEDGGDVTPAGAAAALVALLTPGLTRLTPSRAAGLV